MSATVPQTWYKAWVVPVFKKRDWSKCSNYKGISLLSTGYKLYAKTIKWSTDCHNGSSHIGESEWF